MWPNRSQDADFRADISIDSRRRTATAALLAFEYRRQNWDESTPIFPIYLSCITRLRGMWGRFATWNRVVFLNPPGTPQAAGNGGFLRSLEEVSRGAGVHIWDWDVVQNTLQLSYDP